MGASTPGPFEREYFEANYRNYSRQNPARKLRFYRDLAERAAGGVPEPRVLDLGCAFGLFLSKLDAQWRRFGTDASEFATSEASRTVPGVTFARADAAEIPFPGPFEVITAFDVIEHLPSLERVSAAVRAHLAPGGSFIFVVPVYDGPLGLLVRLLDRDPTHVHKRSRDFWLEWAQESFEIVEWWGIVRGFLAGDVYLHQPTRAWRRLAPAIAVVARAKR